jgi:hypothetical protein
MLIRQGLPYWPGEEAAAGSCSSKQQQTAPNAPCMARSRPWHRAPCNQDGDTRLHGPIRPGKTAQELLVFWPLMMTDRSKPANASMINKHLKEFNQLFEHLWGLYTHCYNEGAKA